MFIFYKTIAASLLSLTLAISCATVLSAFEQESEIHPHIGQKIDLTKFEKKVFSQNGEDGVIEHIFETIGVTNQYFVEFGVEGASECNTRYLREVFGWTGLMMDGRYENLAINLQREFITAENIDTLFRKHNVPQEFDLLSIDIDGNDFYAWYALNNYCPRVVVIEYNATHLPEEDKVIIYNQDQVWDQTNYYGASITSLVKLGRLKGYTLVYAEKRGVNLFFIRNDILNSSSFINSDKEKEIYRYPAYSNGPNGGHRQDNLNRDYLSFEEACALMNNLGL